MRKILTTITIVLIMACSPDRPNVVKNVDVDWPTYLGDNGRQHYSSLSQITRDNVSQLELVWKYNSGEPSGTMYTSPLIIDGVLYGLSPKLVAFALDAATGEELWRHDPEKQGAQRGLMYWEKGAEKRIYYSAQNLLIALNANDGTPVPGFGENGRIDMTPKNESRGGGYLGVTVPGVVFEDKLIMGFSTTEGRDSYPGSIRAFSAVDGALIWQFDTIPAPGDPGSETWAEGSLATAGGANVWSGMTLDDERGMLFAPTGSSTPDFYGGDRLGDNLFANCIVALDARTGELKWHFQNIRHDVWDRDNPSPPTLVQFEKDGQLRDGVTLTTKSGHLYLFDRDTGESIYDIVEVETLPSSLPGEVPAPSQPVSVVEIARQNFEVTQRTPEANAYVSDLIADWDTRPYAPPKLGTLLIYPWYDGGAEWGGSAYDPEHKRLILNANDAAGILTIAEIPAGFSRYGSYAKHCGACHGNELQGTERGVPLAGVVDRMESQEILEIIDNGKGAMPAFENLETFERNAIFSYLRAEEPEIDEPTDEVDYALTSGYVYLRDHEGLPGNTPPWGTLTSFDLATGKIVWRHNFGNYLTHPDLNYGSVNYGGPVVTASGLIFIAATPDQLFKAYDTRSGEQLWSHELTAAGFSTPAIYSVNGKQFVVIAAGGGRMGPPSGSEYFAFALPNTE
jgi:quinoprotein glucose dehydrogenase